MEPDLHPYGACYHDIKEKLSTGVIEFLKQRNVDVVVVGGLAFDFCVKTTVIQLERAGFQVIVYLGATRALTSEGYQETKKQLEEMMNIRLVETRNDLAVLLN